MKLAFVQNHHNAIAEWEKREASDWLTDIFAEPRIHLGPRCTTDIREHVRNQFVKEGWAINVKISADSDLKVFAVRDDLAAHLQTGNMSRAPYDLLKLQYLYESGRIEASALLVPSKAAADAIGSNIANGERIGNELQIFSRIITVPIFLVAFE